MRVVVPILIACASTVGCNQLLGLDDNTAFVDSAVADPDRDDDGLPNEADSCPDAANPDQHDEDGDGLGDPCDPCPLDADTNDDADDDGIHDLCDPHPMTIDCLRLFDSFQTYSDTDWGRAPGSQIDPGVDEVRLRIAAGGRTGIGPMGVTGPAAMRVRFAALTIGSELRLSSRSSPNNTDDGHQCSLTTTTITLANVVAGAPPITTLNPAPVAGAPMTVSILHDADAVDPRFSCLPTPGLPVPMTANISPFAGANGNQPMIVGLGTGTDLVLSGASFYGPPVDGACAAAVFR